MNRRGATSFGAAARLVAVAATFALSICPSRAAAGPPFQVDDPEPVAYRHFEVYISSQYAQSFRAVSGSLPALELTYGVAPNVQLAVAVQLSASRATPSAPWKLGYGDMTVGAKIRFVQETAHRPQLAFYPSIVIPTGDAKNALGGGSTKLFLPVWAQKDVGRWTVFGGGGLWRNPGSGNQNYTFSGIAAQRPAGPRLTYGAELFHATADTVGGSGSTGFSLGMIRTVDERHHVFFSVGRSLGPSNALNAYAAYKLDLGPAAVPAAAAGTTRIQWNDDSRPAPL